MMLRSVWFVLWLSVATTDATEGRERPRCPPEVGDRCQQNDYSTNEYFYKINGVTQIISFSSGNYYKTTCGAALDDPAQPRFERPTVFRKVVLAGCAAPAGGSYGAVLAALGLRPAAVLRLELQHLPSPPAAAALAGLPHLQELVLAAPSSYSGALPLAADALDALPELRHLSLQRVRPARLPPTLTKLLLRDAGLGRLPPAPAVRALDVADDALREPAALAAMPALSVLSLDAPLPAPPPLPAALEEAVLSRLQARHLVHWPGPGGARLRDLGLRYGRLERLAPGWLAGCGALRRLALEVQPELRALPPGLLRGAGALTSLRITSTPLETLPADLFLYTDNLENVTLSRNRLKILPSEVFAPLARSLRSLELSRNALQAGAGAALAALEPLTALEALSLAFNPLGEVCAAHSWAGSALAGLRALRRLSLSGAGVSRLCADWLRDMPRLRLLDLSNNNVSALQLADVAALRRSQPSAIDLSHNPVGALLGGRHDYRLLQRSLEPTPVTAVLLSSELQCDCDTYWWWRALQLPGLPVTLQARCGPPAGSAAKTRDLRDLAEDDLTCPLAAPGCPAPCSCRVLPTAGAGAGAAAAAGAARPMLDVQCAAAPAHAPALPVRRLSLTDEPRLTRLPRLPPDLQPQVIDLSNNNISRDSAEAAESLLAGGRQLLLGGNPLACDCGPGSLLDALRPHRARLGPPAGLRCADGRPLLAALAGEPCASTAPVPALAAAALGAGALLAATAAWMRGRGWALRLRLKAALRRRGWPGAGAGASLSRSRSRPYDVFVSHAPEDERWVVQQLAPRLEAAGLRLCVRARDWPPGAWIPAMIEASVRAAERVLVVHSAHWARAAWPPAELRAAHAHMLAEPRPPRAPRLLLLRLDDEPLVPSAAAHAAHAARLRWGERAFWPKLLDALCAPAPAPPAPAPATAVA